MTPPSTGARTAVAHSTADEFVERLNALRSDEWVRRYATSFPIEKRNGDEFIGVRMGDVFALAKEFTDLPVEEIETLLESPVHEVRVGAVSIMDFRVRRKSTTDEQKKELFELYLRRHDRIDTWDLVDRSGFRVVGDYLVDTHPPGTEHAVLRDLACSEQMARRRTAIIAAGQIARRTGDTSETFAIAELLIDDDDDLIHKAVGWMLRVAGDIESEKLIEFLDTHAPTMPRAMIRQATEHLDPDIRARYVTPRRRAER